MATTQQILDAAKKVGDLIGRHESVGRLERALKALEADTDAQRAMADLNRHIQAVAEKEAAGKPIEVDDKHKLQTLQQTVVMNAVLREFQMAQMDYVDLLRRVDEQITGGAPAAEGPVAPAQSAPINPDLSAGLSM